MRWKFFKLAVLLIDLFFLVGGIVGEFFPPPAYHDWGIFFIVNGLFAINILAIAVPSLDNKWLSFSAIWKMLKEKAGALPWTILKLAVVILNASGIGYAIYSEIYFSLSLWETTLFLCAISFINILAIVAPSPAKWFSFSRQKALEEKKIGPPEVK
jgi:hypothetical protein